MTHLNEALEIIREMKCNDDLVDGLDVADRLIQAAIEEKTMMISAISCFLGYFTGNMDGDWDVSDNPVKYARSVLSRIS